MINNKWSLIRGCVGAWHARNFDAAGNSGAGEFRNMGRTPASAIGALPLQNSATVGERPQRVIYNGLNLFGVSGNSATVSDNAALRPLGDMRVVIRARLADWTPAATSILALCGANAAVSTINFNIFVDTGGNVIFFRPTGGTGRTFSYGSLGFTDGAWKYLRFTFDADDGSGHSSCLFQYSDDGVNWSSGSTKTAILGDGNSNTTGITVGSGSAPTNPLTGTVGLVQIWSDIVGTTKVLDINFAKKGNDQASFTADSGQTVTINRSSTGAKACLLNGETSAALVFDGVDDRLTDAANALLDFADGESGICGAVVRYHGTPGASERLFGKKTSTDANAGYAIRFLGSRAPAAIIADGTDSQTATSAATTDRTLALVSAVWDANNLTAFTNDTAGTPASRSAVNALANATYASAGMASGVANFAKCEVVGLCLARRAFVSIELKRLLAQFVLFGAGLAVAACSPSPLPSNDFLTDNAHHEDRGAYVEASPFSRAVYTTSATSVTIEACCNIYTNYPQWAEVDVRVNGTSVGVTKPSANGAFAFTQALGAGAKTVEIITGLQSTAGGATPRGVFLTSVSFNAAASSVPVAPSNLAVYGDSITVGANATSPVTEGVWMLVRHEGSAGTVGMEAWGYRALYDDAITTPLLNQLVARFVELAPSNIWLSIGTNDYGLNKWNAASFGTAYASLLDALHVALPNAHVYCQSPLHRSSEVANGSGSTTQDYRDAISAAASTRAWCTYIDGRTLVSPTNLADGVHPTTAGHAEYATNVLAELAM